ncbi:MAG TPA: LysR family transcriptional regulator [Paraburkholderia sp.]|nr:LysR family transcriptional regulator [Paraburkholderia sp.]
MMNHLQAMRVFLKVAENGSFARAAESLQLSKAVITRYVGLLESHLNARLLHRTTRSLSLTDAGRDYAEGCRRVLAQIEQMEENASMSVSGHSGTLKVVAAAALAPLGLTALFQQFRVRYPATSLQVTLSHRPVNLVEEGFDVGIVLPAFLSSNSLISRPLFSMTSFVVASPEYIARYGMPATPDALALHPLLDMAPDAGAAVRTFTRPGDVRTVHLKPVYTINSALMLRRAALAGMGIAILPEPAIEEDLARGALVRVLPAYTIGDSNANVSIVYPSRRHVPARTRAFVDFTLAHFGKQTAGPACLATPLVTYA